MDSALLINQPSRFSPPSFDYTNEREKTLWQEPPHIYAEIETPPPSYKKATQSVPDAGKVDTHILDASRQHNRNSSQELYDQLPDAEDFERVSESQAKSILVNIHNGMHELKESLSKNDELIRDSSKDLYNFDGKHFEYIIFSIRELSFDVTATLGKSYAQINELLSQYFKNLMEEGQRKEEERFELIKEQKAKAHKTNVGWAAADWTIALGSLVFAGSLMISGGATAIVIGAWFGTGITGLLKAGYETDALVQELHQNDKGAEESRRIAMIWGCAEMALGLSAIGLEAAIKYFSAMEKAANIVEHIPLDLRTSLENVTSKIAKKEAVEADLALEKTLKQNIAELTQEALKAEKLDVPLQVIERWPASLWAVSSDLKPLVTRAFIAQWKVLTYMRALSQFIELGAYINERLLNIQLQECERLIQTLNQDASALKFTQTVTHQIIQENVEHLNHGLETMIEMLKLVQQWLTSYFATINTAIEASPL